MFAMNIDRPTIVNIMLEGARKCTNERLAVELFERALSHIEKLDGRNSMNLAPVLAELCECYEKTGQDRKARECRFRLSELLRLISKSA